MTFYTAPTPASSEPAAPKRVSFIQRPLVKLVAYIVAWFVFAMCLTLAGDGFATVQSVGGFCASGSSAYVIQNQCPQLAVDFLPWIWLPAMLAIGVGVIFASGIGIQLRVWWWPALFVGCGILFLTWNNITGYLVGALFIVMGVVPLALELKASPQRVFLGSFNIFGKQFKEGAKAQPSFSSRKMPNPPDAVSPTIGDWAVDLLGFAIPAYAGYYVATLWVASILGTAAASKG